MVVWTVPNQSVSLTRVTDYKIMDYSALDYGITDFSDVCMYACIHQN